MKKKNNFFEEKKAQDEKAKQRCLSLLDSGLCRVAIDWMKEKIKENGGKIKDVEKFEIDVKEYIENSWLTIRRKAVLSSAPTLFDATPQNENSLRNIFDKNKVKIGGYMFSITITPSEVLVADGLGSTRRRVDYDSEKQKFIYGAPLYQKGSEL